MSEPTERIDALCPRCGSALAEGAPACECGWAASAAPRRDSTSWARVLDGPFAERATLRLRDVKEEKDDETTKIARAAPLDREGWRQYKLLGKIGEGGMGVVYLALDQDLGRKVAIKVLQVPDLRDEDRQRFLAEAQITSQLSHPNIVPVHEIGWTPQNEIYYTMKRVRGRELSAVLADLDRPPTTVERVRVLIDVCHAVEYAHARGVVHRDLKPENILIGKYGEVWVVDWGLALLLDGTRHHPSLDPLASRPRLPEGQDDGRLTRAGEVIGTITYMSPEQARGEHHLVGPETDVYALGAVLYEMLADRPPFVFPKTASARDMLLEVAEKSPPPPRQVKRDVPPDLEAIALKAISSRMTDRYREARRMRADLEAFLESRPVSAYRAGPLHRLAKLAGRYRAVFLTACLAATALLVSLAAFAALQFRQVGKTQAALAEAESQRDKAQHALAKARAAEAGRARAEAARLAAETARLAEQKERLEVERAETRLSAGLFMLEGDPHSTAGLEEVKAAVAIAPRWYRGHFGLARCLAGRGDLPGAMSAIQRAIELRPDFLPAWWVKSEILEARLPGETKAGGPAAEETKGLLREVYQGLARMEKDEAGRQCALGRLALLEGKHQEADRLLKRALTLNAKLPGIHSALAALYHATQQLAKREQHAQKAAANAKDQLAREALQRAFSTWEGSDWAGPSNEYSKGLRLVQKGDFARALPAFEKAAEGFAKLGVREQEMRCRYFVALCHTGLGKRDAALTGYRRVLAASVENKDEHLEVLTRGQLGVLMVNEGRYAEGTRVLAQVVEYYLKRRDSGQVAIYAAHLASAEVMAGEVGRARTHVDLALEHAERQGERSTLDHVGGVMGLVLRYEGRADQAMAIYRKLAGGATGARRANCQLLVISCLIELDKLEQAERALEAATAEARKAGQSDLESNLRVRWVELRRRQGRLEDALELLSPHARGGRVTLQVGILGLLAGKRDLAAKAFEKAVETDHEPHYARCYLALLDLAAGKADAARRRFAEPLKKDPSWPAPILSYLLGETSEEALRAEARSSPVRQLEVAYYLGEKKLAEGDRLGALAQFRRVAESRLLDQLEYHNGLDRVQQLVR